ncbi:hypothetical protein CGI29_23740 [Vibrio parahaemolyticus]|uniref:hypothetical protein n=1 Tax=Vibrio parahaemolyticus TaxID=670 RepID=UPI001123EC00|nr:hypothetical protein [Vibrio parahaemolyticus]EJG0880203.1 hypothetical protein [Vibrio parahaemolyticus]MDF4601296.1 hypothetical protein [Vibrio parahaemolyticus]TOJ27815.1 hypothetical protein CGI41_23195 [Vibrio parahaemolyticus]TOJ76040.1 hypothetical protein CGI31_23040 [Vibrio parahaemolyticus]TOJ90341.1 hypothetical protein CGI29_23740 [Vibrio parahaemolyticus]
MLIPFGLKDGKYYDVSEVERGRACGCICPSCKQVLVAKKGDPLKMAHHFAHDKKAQEDQDEKIECEYSFCVVARLVIKQSLRELTSFEIQSPEWKIALSEKDKYERTLTVTGNVTKANILTFKEFEVEPIAPYNEVDVLCYVSGYPIGIYFSYQGRPAYSPTKIGKLSILEINLELLKLLYDDFKDQEYDSFKDLALAYVFDDGDRRWLSHARYATREKELKAKLKAMIDESNTQPPEPTINIIDEMASRHRPYKQSSKMTGEDVISRVTRRPSNEPCVRCKRRTAGYVDSLICADCLQYYYGEGLFHVGDIKKAVKQEFS